MPPPRAAHPVFNPCVEIALYILYASTVIQGSINGSVQMFASGPLTLCNSLVTVTALIKFEDIHKNQILILFHLSSPISTHHMINIHSLSNNGEHFYLPP